MVSSIDNGRDFNNYVSSFASKVGNAGDIRYQPHPVCLCVDHTHNISSNFLRLSHPHNKLLHLQPIPAFSLWQVRSHLHSVYPVKQVSLALCRDRAFPKTRDRLQHSLQIPHLLMDSMIRRKTRLFHLPPVVYHNCRQLRHLPPFIRNLLRPLACRTSKTTTLVPVCPL